MAPRMIDHVVWAVPDLEKAALACQASGFTLTPPAFHPPNMGTANQLVQLTNDSFVEFIEVDRPEGITPHKKGSLFSFGAHARDFLKGSAGITMAVFQTADAFADAAEFRKLGLLAFEPFDFGRQARREDGSVREVAFRLAFAIHPDWPDLGCFCCHNRFPENFWNSAFQTHKNTAMAMSEVIVAAEKPGEAAAYLATIARSQEQRTGGHWVIPCGHGQSIRVAAPDLLSGELGLTSADLKGRRAYFAGIRIDAKRGPGNLLEHPAWGQSFIQLGTLED